VSVGCVSSSSGSLLPAIMADSRPSFSTYRPVRILGATSRCAAGIRFPTSLPARVYLEGAVRVSRAGASVGRGYLELTGYANPLRIGK
jgi:hypothetical protein